MQNDNDKLYALLHTFQSENTELALQIAEGQGNTDFLNYWEDVKKAVKEVWQCNDYFIAYGTIHEITSALALGQLILTGREIPLLACALHRLVRVLSVTDSRENEPDNIYQGFEPSLYLLLRDFKLLESFKWVTDFPLLLRKDISPLPLLKELTLWSNETVTIPSLSAFPALEVLQITADKIEIAEGSDTVTCIVLGHETRTVFPELFPPWLAWFPNTKELSLNNCAYCKNPEILAELPQLKTLAIYKNTDIYEIPSIITQLPKLENLTLENCSTIGNFDILKQLPQLKTLNLRDTLHEGKYASCDRFDQVVRELQLALPNTEIIL